MEGIFGKTKRQGHEDLLCKDLFRSMNNIDCNGQNHIVYIDWCEIALHN